MILVDTSVWIGIFRGGTDAADALREALAGDDYALTRFHQLELLQGARDEPEWELLDAYLGTQEFLELAPGRWKDAARTYFELRRAGKTVRRPIDCCIAEVALQHDVLLVHRDRDFETIAAIRPLRQIWLEWK